MIVRYLRNILCAVLIFSGCTNPFTTRQDQVEPPDFQSSNSVVVYDPAIAPEIVFTNFRQALEQKNVQEYMKCLISPTAAAPHGFVYEPERYYKNEFTSQPWTLNDERDYFLHLTKSPKSNYPRLRFSFSDTTLSLRPITPASVNDSVETGNLNYRLEVVYSSDSTAVYRGFSRFKLYRTLSAPETWHIYYWQDFAVNEDFKATWTYLRLQIRKAT